MSPAPRADEDAEAHDPGSGPTPARVCLGCGATGTEDEDGCCGACGTRLPAVEPCEPAPADVPRWPPTGALRLHELAVPLAFREADVLLHRVLDLAERFERAGLSWRPVASDLARDEAGELYVAELRGVQRLEPPQRFEVERVLHALGPVLLPQPMIEGPPRLVRLLLPQRSAAAKRLYSVADARAELAAIAPLVPLPPDTARNLADVRDIGLKRERDEDATAVASGVSRGNEPWFVLVVCDGVASSSHAGKASTLAATTARDVLAHHARCGDIDFDAAAYAVDVAIRTAHIAVCAEKLAHEGTEPPGTTIVAALVYRGVATIGWVGDSRAYWLTNDGAELLTRDHSWINDTLATGRMSESDAAREPLAHALTRCLGPLEVGDTMATVEPDVRTRKLVGPGHLLLCSDGLWNYYSDAAALAKLVRGACDVAEGGRSAARVARHLVNHALVRGGGDNVSVAVYVHDDVK